MRLFHASAVLCSLLAAVVVEAQSHNASFIAEEIAKISRCGMSCLLHTVPAVGCTILDTTCQCKSSELTTITADCMMANCTVVETLDLSKIQAAVCERPYESRNEEFRITIIFGCIFSYGSVLLRLVSRLWLDRKLGLDDYFIICAVVSDIIFTYFGVQIDNHGFGEHVWMLDISEVTTLLYWFYVEEIIYPITIALIKLSILVFYLHIFIGRSFKIKCYVMMAFCITSLIAFTFVSAFQCSPIAFTWDKSIKGAKCINYNAASWANAGINIIQDVLIVLLPVPELRKLNLSLPRKVGLYAMFSLGSVVCILSIIRLYSLRSFGLTADPTWDNVPTTFWSCLETTAAVVCACLPTIRAGFNRLYPKIWESTSRIWTPKASETKRTSAAIGFGYVGPVNRPLDKEWPAYELSSISTLSKVDEEAPVGGNVKDVPQRSIKIVIQHRPDLMKPLPMISRRQDPHRSLGSFSVTSDL